MPNNWRKDDLRPPLRVQDLGQIVDLDKSLHATFQIREGIVWNGGAIQRPSFGYILCLLFSFKNQVRCGVLQEDVFVNNKSRRFSIASDCG